MTAAFPDETLRGFLLFGLGWLLEVVIHMRVFVCNVKVIQQEERRRGQ